MRRLTPNTVTRYLVPLIDTSRITHSSHPLFDSPSRSLYRPLIGRGLWRAAAETSGDLGPLAPLHSIPAALIRFDSGRGLTWGRRLQALARGARGGKERAMARLTPGARTRARERWAQVRSEGAGFEVGIFSSQAVRRGESARGFAARKSFVVHICCRRHAHTHAYVG